MKFVECGMWNALLQNCRPFLFYNILGNI